MFEHSLIDLETKPQTGRRWLSLPIAVGLHVAGLTAFAFGSYWTVGTVPDPQLNAQSFVEVILPPPPSGGGGGPKPVKPDQKPATAPPVHNEIVQPKDKDVPDKPPTPTKETTTEEIVPGPHTDGPGPAGPGGPCVVCPAGPGPIGPGPGGPGGPGVEPSVPADTEPIHFSVGMTRPEILHQVQPRYSELARRAGVQGTVIVEAVIDEQGEVTRVRLLHGLPMNLDRAAVEAIQQWRFKPAMMGGHPVKVYYTLTVNFTIQR
ncbi:MAG: hypothetical protein QOF89_4380 [Acidobacteriota bacterium]|jgi:protein TonB|nr:hypothetical protein [Acidobacteriota bacterium]